VIASFAAPPRHRVGPSDLLCVGEADGLNQHVLALSCTALHDLVGHRSVSDGSGSSMALSSRTCGRWNDSMHLKDASHATSAADEMDDVSLA